MEKGRVEGWKDRSIWFSLFVGLVQKPSFVSEMNG